MRGGLCTLYDVWRIVCGIWRVMDDVLCMRDYGWCVMYKVCGMTSYVVYGALGSMYNVVYAMHHTACTM